MRQLFLRLAVVATLLCFSFLFNACSEATPPAATPTPTPVAVATEKPAASIAPLASTDEVAVVTTALGKFTIRFFPEVAPKHVEHFKKLARERFFNGLGFHRVIPSRLIQGGDPTTRGNDRSQWGKGEPGQETVPAEFSTLPFDRGTLGAARKGGDVNSATSQFFVCLDRNPSWDGQYTVFGQVISGLDVVEKISQVPSNQRQNGEVMDKVVINNVAIVPAGSAQK